MNKETLRDINNKGNITRLLLVISILLVFYRAIGFQFVTYDDPIHIYNNPFVNNLTVGGLLYLWKFSYLHLYIPFTYTVWAVIGIVSRLIYGGNQLNPLPFHTANIILHILNTLLVFTILKSLLDKNYRDDVVKSSRINIGAGVGAILFAIHPLQAESVAWTSEMKGLLATLFMLIAIWKYLSYAEVYSSDKTIIWNRHYILSLFAFLLALSSKPTAVILPLILVVLDTVLMEEALMRSIKRFSLWFLISMLFVIVNKVAQPDKIIAFVTPLWARPFVALDTIGFYFGKLFIPFKLNPDYGHTPKLLMESGQIYYTWIPAVALIAITRFTRKRKLLMVSIIIFIVAILPVSGIVPFYFQDYSTVADRYIYFPMFGGAIAASWFVSNHYSKKIIIPIFFLLLLMGIATSRQAEHWRDDFTLNSYILSLNPNSYGANINLGMVIQDRDIDEAERLFRKAIEINPKKSVGYYNVACITFRKGNVNEAEPLYKKAIELNPTNYEPYYALANINYMKGNIDESIKYLKKTIKVKPGFQKAYKMLVAITSEKDGSRKKKQRQ